MRTLSLDRARRIALTSMGFDRPRPPAGARRDVRHLRRVLDTVDIVQLDSVNVLARAHELPFWSRLGPHDRAARDAWLWRSRELYEGWIHVASITSTDVWPLLHHRRAQPHPWRGIRELPVELLDQVLSEVTAGGPTSVRELTDPGRRKGPWWGMPRGKAALEHLASRGDLAVDHRTSGFVTVYDLAERVLPAQVRAADPLPTAEAHRALLRRAARAHGIGTAVHLADHHRLPIGEARAALRELAASGELEEVRVAGLGNEPVYVHPGARAARTFPVATLLSPFDPLVWHRERTERLFGFRYRIEIYVPEARRVHGYYVLPFLLGDRLVARVDLKADRGGRRLLVRSAFAEPDVDHVAVAAALGTELQALAAWLGLDEVEVEPRGDLSTALGRASP